MSAVERPTDGPFPPDTRVRWLADNRAGVVVARPPGRTGDGVFVVFDGTEAAAHIDPRTLTRDAVDRTDGPDTALAAAIAWFRTVADVHAEMRFYEAWGHAATIVRAVLARPAAGRDLTAQDVQRAYDGTMRWEPIADYLNGIARPAVARTDGQPPADDPPPPSPDPRGDGLCPNCPTDLATLDSGHGVCVECGWTSDPGKCMELYDRIDELVAVARNVVDLVDRTVDMPGVVRDVVDNLRDALCAAPADDTAAPNGPTS